MVSHPWTDIPAGPHDIRLVVADMDGTLLDGLGEVPEEFWPMLERMSGRAVEFVPASGRQWATLSAMFGHALAGGSLIAENGTVVVAHGEVVQVIDMPHDQVRRMLDAARAASERGLCDIGVVLCGLRKAYITRRDGMFVRECGRYYRELDMVDDLYRVDDRVLKVAVFDVEDAERTARTVFAGFADTHQVVVSGRHWVDIMDRHADKLQGVRAVQRALGVTPEQTAVFGDYLNDMGMLSAGRWSFAMANAHTDLKRVARYEAPSNIDHGVVQVLRRLLALSV